VQVGMKGLHPMAESKRSPGRAFKANRIISLAMVNEYAAASFTDRHIRKPLSEPSVAKPGYREAPGERTRVPQVWICAQPCRNRPQGSHYWNCPLSAV